jgi:hypothetical protein
MKTKIITIAGLILSSISVFGQKGSIAIHSDDRLKQRVVDYGTVLPPNPTPQIDGFRVQITFEQSKEAIESAKTKFSKYFADIPTYTVYKAPNFFLKAGDFRTMNEAEKVKSSIEAEFPTSTIVKEKVNLPRIE